MTSPDPTPLTPTEVTALEVETRTGLSAAVGNLARLREGGAHTAAGLSWAAYVLDRFGDLLAQLALPVEERRAFVASAREDGVGASVTSIAEKLGVSAGTVQNDRRALREAGWAEPATTRGADGKVRPTRLAPRVTSLPLPAPTGRVYEQAAEWLRRAGADGLTRLELAARAGWSEGKAGGALADTLRVGLGAKTEAWRAGQRVFLHR